jgi:hypothetical protein
MDKSKIGEQGMLDMPNFLERDKGRRIKILRGVIYSVMGVALFSEIVIQLTVPGYHL